MAKNERRAFTTCVGAWRLTALVAVACVLAPANLRADAVTEWNQIMLQAEGTAKTSPLISSRVSAFVEAAVFDAVNGIERRYTPIHIDFNAPPGASERAAAIQAAYATLVVLFPSQKGALDAQVQASLASIASGSAAENSQSIALGVQWGQTVANDILAWRSNDGFRNPPPPFLGGTAIGEWRPTPPGFLPGAAPQFASMTPWAISSPSQFRPAGPPALTSDLYTSVFNEIKTMGSAVGSGRTADQTLLAQFWNSETPAYLWNHVAQALSAQRNLVLSENARLFAMLNIALADAAIACWEAKYHYVFWRPVTAVALADLDGNPATDADSTWSPLLITPNFPEYPSGHATASAAAAGILAAYFGDGTAFSLESDTMPGVVRSFSSFSQSVLEVNDARVFAGIHFRSACLDGNLLGRAVASFIFQNALQPQHGELSGQVSHNHGGPAISGDGETPDGEF